MRPTQATQPKVKTPPVIKNGVLQLRPAGLPPHQETQRLNKSTPSERADCTLRNLVGLVSHFESLTGSSSNRPVVVTSGVRASTSYPALGSAENPIEVDDCPSPTNAVNNALVALASTVTNALKQCNTTTSSPPSFNTPTVNTILHHIKTDTKLIPILKATHDYLADISQGSGSTSSQALLDRSQESQLNRGRRVLGDLLGLFERGFAKARAPSGSTKPREPPKKRQKVSSANDQSASESAGMDSQRMTEWLSSLPSVDLENAEGMTPTFPGALDIGDMSMSNFDFNKSLPNFNFDESTSNFNFDESMSNFNFNESIPNFDFDESLVGGFDVDLGSEVDWQSFMPATQNPDEMANQSTNSVTLEENQIQCQSLCGQSSCTMPTASGASTPGGATPFQRTTSPIPQSEVALSAAKTRSERRGNILANAKNFQAQLQQELENVRVERWELLVENGILRDMGTTAKDFT